MAKPKLPPQCPDCNQPIFLSIHKEAYDALQTMINLEEAGDMSNLIRSILAAYLEMRGSMVKVRPASRNARKIVKIKLEQRPGDAITDVIFTAKAITFRTMDGREITRSLDWAPWLKHASEKDRAHKIIYGAQVYWPRLEAWLTLRQMLLSRDQAYSPE